MRWINILLSITLILWVSCEQDDSTTNISIQHSNSVEYDKLGSLPLHMPDPLKFVLVSDIHNNYDILSAAIEEINLDTNLRFIVCCGDITDFGAMEQYESYVATINTSLCPVFSIIGNHDCLSGGSGIYTSIFGPANFSFVIGDYEFILFDNIDWDLVRSPNYKWLKMELSDNIYRHIVMAHYPPWENDSDSEFEKIVTPSNTVLCLHGHTHVYAENFHNNIHTLVSTAMVDRKYYIVSISDTQSTFQTVAF
jgi:3',5'-cyclic-AMP phosphodiesterase